ncbi:probable serine/threonine-protein kinase PBL19 [Hordeum vulgare subsp. vulgare]|uniref:probable serine/threonine-protein kinase PBL19 n=1 Tax=Hordeum vulgare subsp. vulgare TaxID=112509 RepID=UPI000B4689CD|nr:probable serine/threonine-protein kinase PBL19 [Hordeum vulgare subsp. vulgare]
MGCFAFKGGKSKPAAEPKPDGPKRSRASSSSASTPTRSIQELSEERGAARLRVFGLEELGSATNGFSRALKVGEGGFGSVYRAFFRSAAGGRVVLAVKRLNQRSLQVRNLE